MDANTAQRESTATANRTAMTDDSTTNITNNQLNHDDFSKSLEYFNLHEISQYLMCNLSHGQRKKVSLTKLLLTNSELWILDEPFNGLDIESTEKTKTMIEDNKKYR